MGSDNEVWQQYELYTWAVFAHVYIAVLSGDNLLALSIHK